MDIKEVKTSLKVGDIVLKENHKNKIKVNFLSHIKKEILTDNGGRVYLFVVDGIIKKIGGSSAKGGIKATMGPYMVAMTGSPGPRSYITHRLIERELRKGCKVELFMIVSPKSLAEVNGLFGSKKIEVAAFKEMEDFCKSDYYSKEGRYPDWNFQERNEDYPKDLYEEFNNYHQKRVGGS